MTAALVVTLASGFLALYFLLRTFHCLRHRKIVRAGGAGLSCCASGALCAAAAVLALSLYGYGRLVDEQTISRIEFRQIGSGEYEARLMIDGERDRLFVLRGDEWQMDAKIITWEPPMTILGLDPLYQLDRLSGRYASVDDELTAVRTVHSLAPDLPPIDAWQAARRFPRLAPGVDAFYGTATFVPMADGARYEVSLSRDALIARPVNAAARDAVGDWGAND